MPQGKTALLLYEAERTFYGLFMKCWQEITSLLQMPNRTGIFLSVKKGPGLYQCHYREPLSVKELSGLSNYSEFYFYEAVQTVYRKNSSSLPE